MSSQGNGGIFSKFQERLRRIRLIRSKKNANNEQFIQDKVEEIRRVIRQDPSPMYRKRKSVGITDDKIKNDISVSKVIADIHNTADDRNYGRKKVGIDFDDISKKKVIKKNKSFIDKPIVLVKKDISTVSHHDLFDKKKDDDKKAIKISGQDEKEKSPIKETVSNIRNQKNKNFRNGKKRGIGSEYKGDEKKVQSVSSSEKEALLKNLSVQIIDKIRNSFEEKLDELEVLESEVYFLKKDQENELELSKIKEIKRRIHELIVQVNEIIDQYNLYNRNYYIDNVIGIDDSVIVDDIINYRNLLDSFSDEKRFVKEYKMLDEFKGLYRNLKSVRDDVDGLVQRNEKKIEEFDIRDKKYDQIKLGVVQADEVDKKCSLELERQNEYFNKVLVDISKINREEYTTYHLRGIGELVNQSLRYMGFLMLSPFSGLLPGIAVQTLATRRMIGNIYHNMKIEEVRHVHYEAVNYDSELNHHLCDVDYTSMMIDDTLRNIEKLKEDFMMQYDSKIPGYDDTLKKIQRIEEKVIHNQNKVDIIKKNLKRSKKINENKLERVKKLNDNRVA